MSGVKLAVQFLRETSQNPPVGDQLAQCLTDLKQVLTSAPSIEVVRGWVASHFGQ